MCLTCEIVRWVADEPQPGIVEARVTDADGRQWSFLDKVAIFDMTGTVGPGSSYPQPGLIRCEALDDVSGHVAPTEMFVTTLRPDAVEAEHGQSTFRVELAQLSWRGELDSTAELDSLAPEDLVGARLLKVLVAWHVVDGAKSPTPVDLWLVLEPVGLVRVDVASDWRLRLDRQQVYSPYDMQDWGRMEIGTPGDGFPLSDHVGSRILRSEADYEPTFGQCMGLTIRFGSGAVRLRSWGGDLLIEAIRTTADHVPDLQAGGE
ncbi:hypothetical protein GCM10009838_66040 [Catenulispora subtropica]|uniref:Uncharacterized protein n=2 Tax=Catenulispora subtropica TaxID=450798 RepID=A0ABP5EA19_9ACTN